MIPSCQDIKFDEAKSQRRIKKATNFFGEAIIKRILCFSLFLLGATRTSIASLMQMPSESVKTTIRNLHKKGLPAFEDGRKKTSNCLRQEKVEIPIENTIYYEKEFLVIELELGHKKIKIHQNNKLQIRALLLTMLNSGLITNKHTAELIKLSDAQTSVLSKKIKTNDINILLDKRYGQVKDYRVTNEIKGDLIQQFVANVATGRQSSSETLAKDLKSRSNLDLSSRTIRYHIQKLGLSKIRKTLPDLIEALKKT